MLRALLAAIAFVALVLAMMSSTPSELSAKPRDTFVLFLPVVTASAKALRGSASCPSGGEQIGLDFCYSYYPHDTVDDTRPYQVVPLIRGADAGPFKVGAANIALILNEPDNCDPNAGDCLTPAQAATVFNADAAQLPNAKWICCGLLHDTSWMDAFLAACGCLSKLSGISFHNYAELDNPPTVDGWASKNNLWLSYINRLNGPYPTRHLESWLTEYGYSPCCEPDAATALAHMQQLCGVIRTVGLTRFAWYIGQYAAGNISLFNQDGTPSQLGTFYSSC